MDGVKTTISAVVSAIQAMGLDATVTPYEGMPRRQDAEGIWTQGVVTVSAGTQKYICVSIADSTGLRNMVEADAPQIYEAFQKRFCGWHPPSEVVQNFNPRYCWISPPLKV